jgi:hypothetical protein
VFGINHQAVMNLLARICDRRIHLQILARDKSSRIPNCNRREKAGKKTAESARFFKKDFPVSR